MIKKPRPTSPSQLGMPQQQVVSWEDIIGKNLMRGDYNPLRGVVGMTEDYNAALTGYRQTPIGLEQEPEFARALTLMSPSTGGAPTKTAASGIIRFTPKSKLSKKIISEAPDADTISLLFTKNSDRNSMIADAFNLDTVKDIDVNKAAHEVYTATQNYLKEQGFEDMVTVYRVGPIRQDVTNVTTSLGSAKSMASYRRIPTIKKYKIPRKDILVHTDHILGKRGSYPGEKELAVISDSLIEIE